MIRAVRIGEVFIPGQLLFVVVQAPEAIGTRILDRVGALPWLQEDQPRAAGDGRIAGRFMASDAFAIDAVIQTIRASVQPAELAGLAAGGGGFSLLTGDVGALVTEAAADALAAAIEIPFRAARKLFGDTALFVAGGVAAFVLGGALIYYLSKN